MAICYFDFTDSEELARAVEKLGADPRSFPYFANKGKTWALFLPAVESRAANALKQEMLSLGGDAAVHKRCIECKVEASDVILLGTPKQLKGLAQKLSAMPYWGLEEVRKGLSAAIEGLSRKRWELELPRGRKLELGKRTLIMGIINVTYDSFYAGSRVGLDECADKAVTMVEEGAVIIDVGAESTRPGSSFLSLDEEMRRLVPAIRAIRDALPDVVISADTYKAQVAEAAVEAGADMINDISGLGFDPDMPSAVANLGVPLILMHIKGTPQDMQRDPYYENVMAEVAAYFEERLALAERCGIKRSQIILDPGIGFGKRLIDNKVILKHIEAFRTFGLPILIGHSRKSFIGQILNQPDPEERLLGTIAASSLCAWKGVEILRVHDVKANAEILKVIEAIKGTPL